MHDRSVLIGARESCPVRLTATIDSVCVLQVKARELRGKKREELETQLETLKQVSTYGDFVFGLFF